MAKHTLKDGHVLKLFGEKIELYVAIGFTLLVKVLLTAQDEKYKGLPPKVRATHVLVSILSGGLVAFYGHDYMIRSLEMFTPDDETLVVIILTLTGEHIVRTLQTLTPEKLAKVLKWR